MALSDYPHLRPYHLDESEDLNPGGAITVDLTTYRDTLRTNVDALIDTLIAAQPTWETELEALKVDINNQIDTDIPATVPVTFEDSLDEMKSVFATELANEDYDYTCAKCGGAGLVPSYEDDGITPTGDTIECDQCDGYGLRTVANALLPNSRQFVDIP